MRAQPVKKGDLLSIANGEVWQVFTTKRMQPIGKPVDGSKSMAYIYWPTVIEIARTEPIKGECDVCGSIWTDDMIPTVQWLKGILSFGKLKPTPQKFCMDCGRIKK